MRKKQTKMSDDLTNPSNYNVNRMVFAKPVPGSIPNSNPPVSFTRIHVKTKLTDGSTGDLLLPTSMLYSYGVQKNENLETGKVSGYSLSLCMWNRDGATDEEKEFVNTINKITEKCKKHLMSVKEDIEKYDLEMNDLKKLNPLWYKRDKGKIVEGKGPVLYPKLLDFKKRW